MVHKPKHKVYSFRGLLGDGGDAEINLERANVNLAFRIVKLQLMANVPGTTDYEHIVKVYREKQTSIDPIINFDDTDLLAAGYLAVGTGNSSFMTVVFDNVLFSRNIYVTMSDVNGSLSCNYYLELEEVPVGASTLMQLKLGVARKLSLSQAPSVT